MSGVGLGVESVSQIEWNLPYVSILLFGAVFGVTGATAVYYKLMSAGESSKVSSFTFLVPLIAVGIGTIFLKEPFTVSLIAGLILILISILIINRPGTAKAKKDGAYELGKVKHM